VHQTGALESDITLRLVVGLKQLAKLISGYDLLIGKRGIDLRFKGRHLCPLFEPRAQ